MGQAIANWPATLRLAALIALVVVLVFGALWLVPLNLTLGPIEIGQL
ncbi:hypothetical protein ACIRG5_41425 [Lentzea sp. NPDC102401]